MNRAIALSLPALFGGLATVWPAEVTAEASPSIPVSAPSLLFSLVRMLGALALVFALFLAGVWLFRNWQRLTIQRGKAAKLNVLEVKSLGPRHALYVVGYEEQRFLLSSAPTGVTMLTALPTASSASAGDATAASPNFFDFLLKAAARK